MLLYTGHCYKILSNGLTRDKSSRHFTFALFRDSMIYLYFTKFRYFLIFCMTRVNSFKMVWGTENDNLHIETVRNSQTKWKFPNEETIIKCDKFSKSLEMKIFNVSSYENQTSSMNAFTSLPMLSATLHYFTDIGEWKISISN